jgi:hypothetical protein
MSTERYEAVLRAFCEEAAISDVQGFIQRPIFDVDDTPVIVEYLEDLGVCCLRMDLGPPPPMVDGIKDMMLALNLRISEPGHLVFGLHPQTDHIVVTMQIQLETLEEDGTLFEIANEVIPQLRAEWDDLLDEFSGFEDQDDAADHADGGMRV